MDDQIEQLEVRRDDLSATRLTNEPIPPVGDGQALLRIDRFGLTANNITYGVAADLVGYWDFFPASDGWGRIPVWGFADVVASGVDTLPLGTRVFGYLPMATHLVVEPTHVSTSGFTDAAGRRPTLPAVYSRYRRTDADPLHSPDTEDLQAIFVPLFATSFVLDDFLADNDDFGARRVVISSASSKTAAGTALCTSRRDGPRPEVVGLTSPGNVAFVRGLGCYDDVVTYDDVVSLDPSVPTVFVDIAGDAIVRAAVHRHLGDALMASCTVGLTHWHAAAPTDELPGPTPQMFFAPTQIEKRVREWGQAGYQERLGAAWHALIDVVGEWVHVVEVSGLAELRDRYLQLLDGLVPPDEAVIVAVGRG
jgi:hypothetical protein